MDERKWLYGRDRLYKEALIRVNLSLDGVAVASPGVGGSRSTNCNIMLNL